MIKAYYRFDGIRFDGSATRRGLETLLRSPSLGRVWIARDRAAAVGYAVVSFNYDLEFGGLEGYVTDIYLRPGYRRRGLGRRLLAVVAAYCRAAGATTLELQVEARNANALAFYRRLGFRRLSRIVMQRELDRPFALDAGSA